MLGDWENPYLTLDPAYEAEIIRAFAIFVEKGLVYRIEEAGLLEHRRADRAGRGRGGISGSRRSRGLREVPDRHCGALSPARRAIVIWTTTPWTLPANLAIAVHPHELRGPGISSATVDRKTLVIADKLVAQFCAATGLRADWRTVAIVSRDDSSPASTRSILSRPRTAIVITADFVTMDTGTGAVHIAPGHGEDDYSRARPTACRFFRRWMITAATPRKPASRAWSANMFSTPTRTSLACCAQRARFWPSRYYQHSYPHCWRSKTPIIFRAVEQFFIRIDDLRGQRLEAIDRR